MKANRDDLIQEHSADQIRRRLADGSRPDYLADFIYGAIDGTVTTFAVVSGVAGANLESNIVIILGLANLVGDGFSMAASNFVGTRTDQQLQSKARAIEHHHIETYPEGEREEIRQIFAAKGFRDEDLKRAVDVITADREQWVDTMLTEELGLSLNIRSPIKAATATMVAFLVVGVIPLAAFIVQALNPALLENPYVWSSVLTGVAFFAVGAFKSRFVEQAWYWSGLETLTVGGSAAILAYLVGMALSGLAT